MTKLGLAYHINTNLFAGSKVYRYIQEGKLNKDKCQGMDIFFNSKMVVTEQFWAYGFLAYIAEMGGFVGLFLGYSVLQLKGFLPYMFNRIYKRSEDTWTE